MVTPNPGNSTQPVNYGQILPLIALAANSKGSNTGDLSKLFNEMMGVMSGSYTPPSQMSDEEIETVYAPTIVSIRNSDDPTLRQILGDIEANTPAWKIKEAIRKAVYNTKTIALQPGQDIGMYDQLVDDMVQERQRVLEKKYEIQNKQTIFEQYGLPDIADRFDPTAMPEYQKLYTDLLSQRDMSSKERDARLKAIEDRFMASQKATAPAQQFTPDRYVLNPKEDKTNIGRAKPDTTNIGMARPDTTNIGKAKADTVNIGRGRSKAAPQAEQMVQKPRETASDAARRRAIELANKEYLKELAGAPARNLKVGATGGAVTEIPTVNLRDPVARQEELMRLVTEKLGSAMEARGQTPLSEALISRLILNKQMGG